MLQFPLIVHTKVASHPHIHPAGCFHCIPNNDASNIYEIVPCIWTPEYSCHVRSSGPVFCRRPAYCATIGCSCGLLFSCKHFSYTSVAYAMAHSIYHNLQNSMDCHLWLYRSNSTCRVGKEDKVPTATVSRCKSRTKSWILEPESFYLGPPFFPSGLLQTSPA
jgi:hypothetical protein